MAAFSSKLVSSRTSAAYLVVTFMVDAMYSMISHYSTLKRAYNRHTYLQDNRHPHRYHSCPKNTTLLVS